MTQKERDVLKKKILGRNQSYETRRHRILRLIKNPIKTIPFYILVLLGQSIGPFKVSAKTIWGDKLKCFLPGENAVFYYGFIEPNLTSFLINFLQEGDVFIDVGAYIGYYSLLASRLVGRSGMVYSFEPTPLSFHLLRENTASTNNIVISQTAVLNKETVINFINYGARYGAFNTFEKRVDKNVNFLRGNENVIKVKTVTLDKYCDRNKIIPTFVKLDAEGSEFLILSGMSRLLKLIRPFISLEVAGGLEWGKNNQESIQFLRKNNYLPFEISPEGLLKKQIVQSRYDYDNLLFVPIEKIGKINYKNYENSFNYWICWFNRL